MYRQLRGADPLPQDLLVHRSFLYAAATAAIIPSFSAAAQPLSSSGETRTDADPSAAGGTEVDPAPGDAANAHPHTDKAIVVTGVRRGADDILGGVSVVNKEQLTRDVRPSPGETLKSQPGVSASSFGPTASRPILRGLSGERVRVL